jgi:hypothetical protein
MALPFMYPLNDGDDAAMRPNGDLHEAIFPYIIVRHYDDKRCSAC